MLQVRVRAGLSTLFALPVQDPGFRAKHKRSKREREQKLSGAPHGKRTLALVKSFPDQSHCLNTNSSSLVSNILFPWGDSQCGLMCSPFRSQQDRGFFTPSSGQGRSQQTEWPESARDMKGNSQSARRTQVLSRTLTTPWQVWNSSCLEVALVVWLPEDLSLSGSSDKCHRYLWLLLYLSHSFP